MEGLGHPLPESTLDPGIRPVTRRRVDREAVIRAKDARARASFGPLMTVALSLWFGMAVGILELGLTIIQKPLNDPSPGLFRMNRHLIWSIPTFDLAFFLIVGLVLAVLAMSRARRESGIVALSLSVLGMFALLLSCRRLHEIACFILALGMGYRLMLRIEANRERLRTVVAWTYPALALIVVCLVGLSLGRERYNEYRAMASLPTAPRNIPNVLMIVLDTVRADRLSLYGYSRETTPNLARLARHGVTFNQARSTAPWTLPSHASIMTGRWPHQLSARLHGPLDETYPTLAEYLSSRGYATSAFVANTSYCSKETGLGRGFAHYEDHDLSWLGWVRTSSLGRRLFWKGLVLADHSMGGKLREEPIKNAETIGRDLLAWADRLERRPFFAFLNFVDAHTPYLLPAANDHHFGLKPESDADYATLDRWFTIDKSKASPREIALAGDAYDDCIAYLDKQIGVLFDELDWRGVLEETVVIVTADHGEHLGEHGIFGHASSLYDPEIHVPLLIVTPKSRDEGVTVDRPVSLRDLPATVVDLVGMKGQSPFPGRSLASTWKEPMSVETEPLLAEVDGPAKSAPNLGRSPAFQGPMKALLVGQEMYIRDAAGGEEVYNVVEDPGQLHHLEGLPEIMDKLPAFRATLEELTRDDARPQSWRNSAGPRRQLGKIIEPAKLAR